MITKGEVERLLGPMIRAGDVVRAEPIYGTSPLLLVRVKERTPEIAVCVRAAIRPAGWHVEIAQA